MRNFTSLYWRNLFSVFAILLISHILLCVVFSAFFYNYITKDKKESLIATANEVSKMVSAYSMTWDLNGLNMRMALSNFSETSGFDILLCDTDGLCVACSDKKVDCEHIGSRVDQDILDLADEDGEGYSAKGNIGGLLDKKAYYSVMPVKDLIFSDTVGYVFLAVNDQALNTIWEEFILLYVMVSAVVVVFAFAITQFVTKMQTQPIDEIAKAANKFARGDFSARVSESNRRDEIGELAEAFNLMADSIEKSEIRRREFVSNVSHELKTPMTTITGFADGILDGTIPKDREREYLELISSEAKRMSRLVRGMLDASRVQEVDESEILTKNFDIVEVVSMALLSLERKITARNLDVDLILPEDAIIVRGDSDTITQVVYNLVDNAAKFATPKTILKVEVWREKSKVFVSVENEGNTIPEDEITSIFDRFHKTDKSRSMDKDGVGLGLYIVKTILDRHGEDIFVKSIDGVTTFTFTLTPISQQPKKEKNEKAEKGQQEKNGGKSGEKVVVKKGKSKDRKPRRGRKKPVAPENHETELDSQKEPDTEVGDIGAESTSRENEETGESSKDSTQENS